MEIKWTLPAVDDLKSIYGYISKDSKYIASSFTDKVVNSVENLKNFPDMGRIVPESDKPDIRELIFQNYRIIYKVKDDIIYILSVIRASRDLSSLKNKPWEII